MKMEPEDHEALLTTAGDSIEAEIIEGLLNANGIPVLKKYSDVGGYMTIYAGTSFTGVDLYVPSRLLDKAKELLENIQAEGEAENAIGENPAAQGELTENESTVSPEDETADDSEAINGYVSSCSSCNEKCSIQKTEEENSLDTDVGGRYNIRKKLIAVCVLILIVVFLFYILNFVKNLQF